MEYDWGVRVLVVNAGSSSVKLRVLGDDDEVADRLDLGPPDDRLAPALDEFVEQAGRIDVAGHRVVHGGERYTGPVLVDDSTRRGLEELNTLAPLHNPPAVAALDALRQLRPELPNVACFDTSFHSQLPPEASRYALPAAWVERWRIRRYGFHGLSCEWATQQAGRMTGRPIADLRLVVCHLGGGASVTAVAGGRSVDTTMGFTPVEGLVMATRSGDVDPGALVWMLRQGLGVDELDRGLEQEAGLLGLSATAPATSDMHALVDMRAKGSAPAASAVEVYLHRLRAKIAAMVAAMDGVDVLIFTGGVGEHSGVVRSDTCRRLRWIGVQIDEIANGRVTDEDTDVTAAGAAVQTLVIHAREDLVIARSSRRLVDQE